MPITVAALSCWAGWLPEPCCSPEKPSCTLPQPTPPRKPSPLTYASTMTPRGNGGEIPVRHGRVEIPSGRRRGNRQPRLARRRTGHHEEPGPAAGRRRRQGHHGGTEGARAARSGRQGRFPDLRQHEEKPSAFLHRAGSGWNSHHIYPRGAGNAHGPQRCLLQGPVRQLCRYGSA